MYDHDSITYEVRERARSRQADAERERIASRAHASRRSERRPVVFEALRKLRGIRSRLTGRPAMSP